MYGQSYLANTILTLTAATLLYMAFTDLRHFKIKNELVLLIAGLFTLYATAAGRWQTIPWNAAFAFFLFLVMLGFYARNLMGGGDIKLLAAAFLWVGIRSAIPFAALLLLFSASSALAGKLGWIDMHRREDQEARIALAPSVAAALIIMFIAGWLRPSI